MPQMESLHQGHYRRFGYLLPAGPKPKRDEQFTALLQGALSGDVAIYFAVVPLALCVPFDLDYRPDLHPIGAKFISQMTEAWSNGQFQNMFGYQRGRWFVVSDDYIVLFAALLVLPDYLPCWALGKPEGDLVRDLQGPIALNDVARLLGAGITGRGSDS